MGPMEKSALAVTTSSRVVVGASTRVATLMLLSASVLKSLRFCVLLCAVMAIDRKTLFLKSYCMSTLLMPRSARTLKGGGSICTRLRLVAIWNAVEMPGKFCSKPIEAPQVLSLFTEISSRAVMGGSADSSAG